MSVYDFQTVHFVALATNCNYVLAQSNVAQVVNLRKALAFEVASIALSRLVFQNLVVSSPQQQFVALPNHFVDLVASSHWDSLDECCIKITMFWVKGVFLYTEPFENSHTVHCNCQVTWLRKNGLDRLCFHFVIYFEKTLQFVTFDLHQQNY